LRSARFLLTALHWLRRLVLVAGWTAVTIVLGAFAALWWLTSTPAGVQWAVQQAERHLPALSVERVSGTPWRGLAVEGLSWSSPQGMRLQLQAGRVQIDPGELWHGRLHLHELTVEGGNLELPPATAYVARSSGGGWQPAGLPPIAIDRLAISQTVVHRGKSRYEVTGSRLSMELAVQGERPVLGVRLDALDMQVPGGVRVNAAGELAATLDGAIPLTARLDLLVDHPRGWLSGQLRADGSLRDGVELAPQLAWLGDAGPPAAICGRLTLDEERLRIGSLRVDGLGGRFDLRGEARWAPRWSLDLSGRGQSIDPAWLDPGLPGALDFSLEAHLAAASGWLPARGSVALSGLEGRLAGESLEGVGLEVRLDPDGADARISGTAAGGELRLDAKLRPDRSFAADWQIDALPIAIDQNAQGARGLQLASRGQASGRLPEWQALSDPGAWVEGARLKLQDGWLQLRERDTVGGERSAALSLAGRLEAGRASVERLSLTAPGVDLSASGDLGLSPDWTDWQLDDVEAALSAPDLSRLPWDLFGRLPGVDMAGLPVQDARGRLDASLSVNGPVLAPSARGRVNAEGLSLAGYSLDRVRASADLDVPAGKGHDGVPMPGGKLALEAEGFRSKGNDRLQFDRLSINVDGRGEDNQVTVDLAGAADAHLRAQGGWQQGRWQGSLSRLTLDAPWAGSWQLVRPAELTLSPTMQHVAGMCLAPVPDGAAADQPGQLCLDGERDAERALGRVQGDLSLETLWRQWGESGVVEWPGRLKVDAQARLAGNSRSAELKLRLPAGKIRLLSRDTADGEGESLPAVVAYPDSRLTARLDGQQLEASLSGGVEDWLAVDGQGQADLADRQVTGELSLGQTDLSRLFSLVERLAGPVNWPVSDVAGSLGGRLSVAGRLDAPRLSGRLTAQGLGFASLPTGTEYRDGRLEASIDPDGRIELSGSLLGEADTPPKPVFEERRVTETAMPRSRGRLELEGSGQFDSTTDWRLNARLGGEAVPLLRLPSLAVDARPDLEGEFRPSGGQLSGSIHVPLAIANLAQLPENARGNSEDLVIVGEEPQAARPGYPVSGEVRLVLGDDVSLRGKGLATRLTGELEMRIRPEEAVGAFGEIRLADGRYEAYGQRLSVERGRLIFTGPLASPGLDIVATRTIDDADGTVVGLRIGGPLESPETEVFSRPPTSPSDALSLLLTGRRLSSGSDADASLLLNAIAGLGIRQGDELAQQVRSTFGIDEIGLSSTDGAEGARLSLGKRIGDNLLVRYAVGVFDGVGEVITRYRINKFLHLELTSRAQSQSGDLIYQIDRGRPED